MAQSVLRTRGTVYNPAHQTVQYIYRRVSYNDVNVNNSSRFTVASAIGALPANCIPLETYVRIVTAFTSGDLVLATTSGAADVVTTSDVVSATSGVTTVVDRYMGTMTTVDTPIYFYTATTGGGAGVADVWQLFLPGPQKDA